MFAISSTPVGQVSCLNLDLLPIWRLELGAAGSMLGIGIRYVASGTTALAMLAAVDCHDQAAEVANIAKVGFPRHELSGDRDRLAEALKILYNTDLKPGTVDEIVKEGTGLADVYHSVLNSLRTGAEASGRFAGYRWVISRESSGWSWPAKDTPPADTE